jgi:hypothetical protein
MPECRQCGSYLSRKTGLCSAIRATQGRGVMPDGNLAVLARRPAARWRRDPRRGDVLIFPGGPRSACHGRILGDVMPRKAMSCPGKVSDEQMLIDCIAPQLNPEHAIGDKLSMSPRHTAGISGDKIHCTS